MSFKKSKGFVAAMEELVEGEEVVIEGTDEEIQEAVDASVDQSETVVDEISEIDEGIDTAVVDGETLENVQDIMEEASEPQVVVDEETGEETIVEPEGVSEEAAAIATEMLKNIMHRQGITSKRALMPATESFSGATRLTSTRIAVEGIGFASTKIWEAVATATEQTFQKFEEFAKSLEGSLESLSAQNTDLKAKVKGLKSAKPQAESIEGLAAVSQVFGVGQGSNITSKDIIGTFKGLEGYIAKAPNTVKEANSVLDKVKDILKEPDAVLGEDYYDDLVKVIGTIGGDVEKGDSDGVKTTSVTLTELNKGSVDTLNVSFNESTGAVSVRTDAVNPDVQPAESLPVLSVKDIESILNESSTAINTLHGFMRVSAEVSKFNTESNTFIKGLVKDYSGFASRFKEAFKQGAKGAGKGALIGGAAGALAQAGTAGKAKFDKLKSSDVGPGRSTAGALKSKAFGKTVGVGAALGGAAGAAVGGVAGAAKGFVKGKEGSFSTTMSNVRSVVLGLNNINKVVSVSAPIGLLSAVTSAQKYCAKSMAAYGSEE